MSKIEKTDAEIRGKLYQTVCGEPREPSRDEAREATGRFFQLAQVNANASAFCRNSVLHGLPHWTRVFQYYRMLCWLGQEEKDMNAGVLFAAFHDSQRTHEDYDSWHGEKAAHVLFKLLAQGEEKVIQPISGMNREQVLALTLLLQTFQKESLMLAGQAAGLACALHTELRVVDFKLKTEGLEDSVVAQVAYCIDADRLDYGRLGVQVDPAMLITEEAKRLAGILNAINFG